MAGIVTSNKVRRLVGNRLKEIDVPTTTLNTALYYADLTAQGASFTQSRVNAELNAYPVTVKNNASLALTPSANKTGVVYALNGDTNTLEEFEFQRGSSGTYFDASGIMQLTNTNIPRVNFKNGVSNGLMIEPARTNIFLNSGFPNGMADVAAINIEYTSAENTGWNVGAFLEKGIRIRRGVATTSAYKTVSVEINKTYVFSCFLKMSDGLNPSNGVGLHMFGVSFTSFNSEDLGGGLFRVWVARNLNTIQGNIVGVFKIPTLDNRDVVVSGYQLEEGTQPSSYIPTSSSISTRLADKVLSKRPTVIFQKNSIFVKTAQWLSTWLGNGVDNLIIAGRNLRRLSSSGDVFSAFQNASITKISNVSVPEWDALDATHLISSGGASLIKAITSLGTPKLDEIVSVSFWIKNAHPENTLILNSNQGSKTTAILPNQAIRVIWDGILGNGNGDVQIQLRSDDTAKDISVIVWRIKNERGTSVTSWLPAPEDYIKVDNNGNIEISYTEPIHLQQFSLISRELKQEEI